MGSFFYIGCLKSNDPDNSREEVKAVTWKVLIFNLRILSSCCVPGKI
jgi:hypothetical protein